jgi:hypothetical protein
LAVIEEEKVESPKVKDKTKSKKPKKE